METISGILDFLLHFDKHLDGFIQSYGEWTYAILASIIFCETGLVIAPFLPGDTLLFGAGVMAGRGSLNPYALYLLLTAAAICGDHCNYWIGRALGPRVLRSEKSRFFKREHIDHAHRFFERYGVKAVVLARFLPILRTLVPFMAGVGIMNYRSYLFYEFMGANLWVGVCVFAGYLFGGNDFVRDNFSMVIVGIAVFSALPVVIEIIRQRRAAGRARAEAASASGSAPTRAK